MPSSSSDSETLYQAHYSQHPSESELSSDDDSAFAHPPLQQPNFFAPPFYNRPPTPLPPSPSLTSLLRPSRPTTPDTSDNELSPSHKPPLPRASPIVPTYEYYGFVLYLFSSLAFLMYLLWSYLPSPFLHALGIWYYPDRWWSLAIPAWIVMLLCYIYVALASYNTGHLTLGMGSLECVVDEAANIAIADGRGGVRGSQVSYAKGREKGAHHAHSHSHSHSQGHGSVGRSGKRDREKGKRERKVVGRGDWRKMYTVGTDAVMDVPLGGVCEVLYGNGRELDSDDEIYG